MNGIISGLSGERPGSSTVAPWDQDIKTHEQSDALFWILSLPKQAFGFRLLERNLISIFDDSLACKLCSKTDSLISWKSCWRTLTDYILLMTSENKPEIVEGWNAGSPNVFTNFYQEPPLVSPCCIIFAAPATSVRASYEVRIFPEMRVRMPSGKSPAVALSAGTSLYVVKRKSMNKDGRSVIKCN